MAKNESRHFEELPQDALSMVQLINEFFDLRVTGTPDNSDPTARELRILMEPDGTVRAYALQAYRDESGDERYAVVGPDGQQFMSQWIYDSGAAAWVRMLGEATGEQKVVNHGKDAAGNIDPFRTNASMQPQVEIVAGDGRPVETVPVPTGGAADVWVPGLASTVYLDVEFELIPIDVAADATGVDLGIDYGNDGGAIEHYFCRNITLTTSEVGTRIGPYRIWGDDAIMANCASGANDAELAIYIVGEGAAI